MLSPFIILQPMKKILALLLLPVSVFARGFLSLSAGAVSTNGPTVDGRKIFPGKLSPSLCGKLSGGFRPGSWEIGMNLFVAKMQQGHGVYVFAAPLVDLGFIVNKTIYHGLYAGVGVSAAVPLFSGPSGYRQGRNGMVESVTVDPGISAGLQAGWNIPLGDVVCINAEAGLRRMFATINDANYDWFLPDANPEITYTYRYLYYYTAVGIKLKLGGRNSYRRNNYDY